MKRVAFIGYLLLSIVSIFCFQKMGWSRIPIKYLKGCEIDLNKDEVVDIALHIETMAGSMLVILLKKKDGYEVFTFKVSSKMVMECKWGQYIKETDVGKGGRKGKVYKIFGYYIELFYPEGPAVVYFWDGNKFKEVWVAD